MRNARLYGFCLVLELEESCQNYVDSIMEQFVCSNHDWWLIKTTRHSEEPFCVVSPLAPVPTLNFHTGEVGY